MDFRDRGVRTQLENIEAQTGKPLTALKAEVVAYGPLKHAERRNKLRADYSLSFVHADTLLLWIEDSDRTPAVDPLDGIYIGAKAVLRPIHEAFVAALADWGPYEMSPKKGYVSLRLKKQFCMIGPATNSRVAVGINAKDLQFTKRLRALPPGKLCPFEVSVLTPAEVDAELMTWVKSAWDQAR